MKKVTKLVTLVSTGLCALALVPAYLATVQAVEAQAANETHSIEFVADDGVTVNVPVVARAGKVVNFSLKYDAEAYEVYGVIINDNQQAAQKLDGSFYFVMPDMDVELTVYGGAITDEDEHYYAIHNVQQEKGVVLNYCTPAEYAGELVFFNVGFTAHSAYTFAGDFDVYTKDAKDQKVAIEDIYYLSSADAYYFEMPEAEVYIDIALETKGFLATFDATDNVVKVETSSDGEHWNTVSGNPYFIKAMDQVKVTVKDTLKRSCEAIQIGEVAYMANEAKEITFEMPTEDVDIKVLTEDILYPFQVTDDTMTNHWDFEFYRCATTNGEYTKADKGACYQDYVRVYATAKEGITGKKVGTLQYTYDANVTWYSATVGEDADGRTYYQFYMAQGKSYSIRVSVENDAKPVAVKNTAHITAKYVKKVNGEWVENTEGFYAGDYIYAQITCEDGYKAGEVKTSYKYSSTSSYGGSTLMSVFDAENNVYRTNATITSTAYVDFAIEWTELSPRTVNFTADENVSFKFVKQDEKHDWVDATGTKYYKGDYCYVQATFLGNEDDFTWKGIEVKNGSSSLTVTTQSSAEKIYSFIMPDADVNVTAQYKGAGAYKGYGFVGKYFGANLYNNSCANKAANSAYNITIDSAGEGAWGTSYFFDIVSLSEGSTKNNGFVEAADWRYNTNAPTRKSNKVLAYGTDFVAAYYSQFSNSAEISVDLNIAVKVQDESDTIGMYKFSGANKFDSNSASATNKGWAAYVAYRNNVVYKCMFIDKSTGYSKYYMSDVEFRFTTGSSVEDKTTAVYDVYAEGVKIGTVDKGTFTKA